VPGREERKQPRGLVQERDARVVRPSQAPVRPSQARRGQPLRARARQLSQAARQPLPAQPVQPLLAREVQPSPGQEHSALALWQLVLRARLAAAQLASVEQPAREQADDFEAPLAPGWVLPWERWE